MRQFVSGSLPVASYGGRERQLPDSRTKSPATGNGPRPNRRSDQSATRFDLIAIGCSLGGMHALQTILMSLSADFCVPIAVVQHRHKASNEGLPTFFRKSTKLKVVDAEDKQPIRPGHVYLAPADYHLLIEPGEINLSVDEAVAYSRPSIDVLFESASHAYRNRLIGVVLTGNNADGARGAKRIKENGGLVVVQDPATAEAKPMPTAAIAAATVDRILRLEDIGPFLLEQCAGTLTR